MKNVMISIGLIVMMSITVLILFTVYGHNTRQNEVEEALSVAIEQTLENMKIKKSYDINNEEEFKADFIQNLALAIESKSEIDVNILNVDVDKGLFDVEVVERFTQPNGSTGKASCRKTVILEEFHEKERQYYFVKFKYEKEPKSGEFEDFKVFSISADSKVIVPTSKPKVNKYKFKGWSKEQPDEKNGYAPEIAFTSNDDDVGDLIVKEDTVFYAVFELTDE